MIRLVASDMDGTLLDREGRITRENALAIQRLQQRGIRFLVCTGRAYEDARKPLLEAQITCDLICMNGAAVYDSFGVMRESRELEQSQVEAILSCFDGEGDVLFDFMTDRGSFTTSGREQLWNCLESGTFLPHAPAKVLQEIGESFQFVSRESLFDQGLRFFKISAIHGDPGVLQRVRYNLDTLPGLSVVSSCPVNLELTSEMAKKGGALLKYAKEAGIAPREILAVGDSENDLSMLSLNLGYTVAMGNASPLIKATARCQTRSNEENGVAFAIENLILCEKASAC